MPSDREYAKAYLPLVAALLASGHVWDGDIVYLPIPHAGSWSHTIKYVYTGQGQLTEAIRDNILYLAGKV